MASASCARCIGRLLIALAVVGCAAQEPPAAPNAAVVASTGLLSHMMTLTGGWRLESPSDLFGGVARGTALGRQMFQFPVAVAARDDLLLIADGGRRQVFAFERSRDAMAAILPYANGAADHAGSMQLMVDGSAWVADPAGGRVVHVTRTGQVLRTLRDDWLAPRPVAVAVPDPATDIFVADATRAGIVVFNPFGRVLRRFGGERGELQSVAAMTLGPDGLYVVDRLAQQVVVFGLDGGARYTVGEDTLTQPRAIAVDRFNRVFVGDDADQAIKVYLAGEHIATFGGPGSAPGRFGRIDGLALDGNLLYVADGLHARVQILLVAPESLRR